jgi:hypothetical protein
VTTERPGQTDTDLAAVTARYPPPDLSPAQFEDFVVELLGAIASEVEDFTVRLHERIEGPDGAYDFDATVRFRLGGLQFLVLVEAKRHKDPIKRELVQVLHAKQQSVGAQKSLMVSTAPYQRGALKYAKSHGMALATVTEGRFTYETRSAEPMWPLSPEEARYRLGLPEFVAYAFLPGATPLSTRSVLLRGGDDLVRVLVHGSTAG